MTDSLTVSPHLQRSRIRTWFLAGVATALFLMFTQALALGGWTSLLALGEDAAIRPVIESQMPGVVALPGAGNDGQIYYAIALEPFDDQYADLLPESSLRWRRILLPVAASMFGAIDGYPLFWMFVGLVAVSMGVATAAAADSARSLNLKPWAAAVVLVHPGLWVGVRLLSPELPAIALSLVAISMALRRRHTMTMTTLVLAVLTKEPYLVVGCSLAAWSWFEGRRTVGVAYLAAPTAALIGWSMAVSNLIPGTVFESGNIAAPFAGIIEASRWWPDIASAQNALTALALLMIAAGIVIGLTHRRLALLHWLLWPWVGLALVSSHWVWRFGNGSLRAFSFVGIISVFMLAVEKRRIDRP